MIKALEYIHEMKQGSEEMESFLYLDVKSIEALDDFAHVKQISQNNPEEW